MKLVPQLFENKVVSLPGYLALPLAVGVGTNGISKLQLKAKENMNSKLLRFFQRITPRDINRGDVSARKTAAIRSFA